MENPMEFIIIKSGKEYIRVKEGEYLRVRLDKASVFPMERVAVVRGHEKILIDAGWKNVSLKKLVLTEEDLPQ